LFAAEVAADFAADFAKTAPPEKLQELNAGEDE